jgi:predicted outer membrane repeat protein
VDDGAKATMEHELFYNNKAKESGSAIFVDDDTSTLSMKNCTVSGNTTNDPNRAAMYVVSSTVSIENSIFWNNGSDFEAVGVPAKLTVNYTLTQKAFAGTGNISAEHCLPMPRLAISISNQQADVSIPRPDNLSTTL